MKRISSLLWRITILLLPWQTRWIFVDGKIGTFPWEQGTVSFYASWVPLLATVACAWLLTSHESRVMRKADGQIDQPTNDSVINSSLETQKHRNTETRFLKIALFLLLAASLFTANATATVMWWVAIAVIGALVWSLGVLRVSRTSLMAWIVIAVLPHAGLGVVQFLTQDILGSTWLGIATHHAASSGTSVVEHGLYRVLRSYGGFPHPNILGGWIAVALGFLPRLIQTTKSKLASYGWLASGFLLTITLIFTFSRGAWVAAALACAAGAVIAFSSAHDAGDRQAVVMLVVVCVLAATFGFVTQWDHVRARVVSTDRLEAWSLFSRTESFAQGWKAFQKRPLAGWGPGAGLLGITEIRKGTQWARIAPEPPHAAPAAFVLETGLLGILALMALLGTVVVRYRTRKSGSGNQEAGQKKWDRLFSRLALLDARLPLIIALTCIALTDHYLVTLWSGIVLLGLAIAVLRAQEEVG